MVQAGQSTIAVVASDPEQQALLRGTLESAGHAVVQYSLPEEALRAVDPSVPDLVLASLAPAHLEGWALCRLVRSPENLSLRAIRLLPLPLDRETLLAQVEAALDRSAEVPPAEEVSCPCGSLAQYSRDIVLVVRPGDGRILDVNPAAVNAYGYSRDELLTLSIHDLRADQNPKLTADQMAQADLSGLLFESVHRRKDGSTFPVEVSSQGATIGASRLLVSGVRDITKRNLAEKALRESEARLREAEHLAQVGSSSWDVDTDTTTWSEELYRIMGRDPGQPAPKHGERASIYTPESWARLQSAVKRALATGEPYDLELEVVRPDGDLRQVHVRGAAARDEHGRVARVYGTLQDITGRKRAEAQLRESEERLRLTLEATSDGVWDLHVPSGNAYFSPRYCAILGFEPSEFAANYVSWQTFVHPDDLPLIKKAHAEHLEQRKDFVFEFRMRHKSGGWRWILSRARVVEWDAEGHAVRMVGTHSDITGRKRVEEEQRVKTEQLIASETRYRQLYESMLDGFARVDMSGRLVEFNEAYRKMLGYEREELSQLTYFDLTPEKWQAMEAAIVANQVLPRGYSDIFEKEYRRKDGTVFPIELRTNLLKDVSGEPSGMWAIVHDITGRKLAEDALRQAEEKFEKLFTSSPACIVISDLLDGGRLIAVNDACERMLGYPRHEIIGRTATEIGILADPAEFDEAFERLKTERALRNFELRFRQKSGEVCTALVSTELIELNGNVCALSAAIDITERKAAEEAVFEAERKYREIFEGAIEGFYRTSREGRSMVANPALARMLGYDSAAEFVSQCADWAHQVWLDPNERSRFNGLLEEQGAVRGYECSLKRKDGTAIWVSLSSRKVPGADGVTLYYEGFIEDITERKRAEEELRLSQQRLALHVQHTPLGVIEFAVDGRVTAWNPGAVEIFGYSSDEAMGQHWKFVTSESLWNTVDGVWERVVAQQGGRRSQNENITRDGRPISCEWFNTPLVDPAGGTIGVASLVMDITGRKQAEEERERLQLQLAQAQKMESIGRLAGGVAHDFNNLLTVINGYSVLLKRQLKEGDPVALWVEEIHNAGERAAQLTRQLLAFSRKQIVEPKRVDLNDLIAETRDMLRRLLGEDIEVVVRLAPGLGPIMADPGSLHQILMNLAVNARDAMPHGGRFTIETANVELDEDHATGQPDVEPGPFVRLTVTDTGTGISEDVRRHIFEPFFTTKGEGEGTGLGLSTVYGIVKQARGSIEVHSEPGHGATFVVHLPGIRDSESPSEGDAAPGVAPRGTETILLVEDQSEVRRLAGVILKGCGYRIVEAANGCEALLAAERHAGAIQLMLTDVVMPGMTGKELSERVKPLRPEMKVLYMSGYAADLMQNRGLLESGVPYIAKPFAPGALAARVREVLGPAPATATILVVEEVAAVREFFRKVLVGAGYEVRLAKDGKEALEIARALKVRAVLTDLAMPVQEGIETVQALRREVPGVGIIAISGAFGSQFLETARLLGADAILSKPVSRELLLEKVAEVLIAKSHTSRPKKG